MLLLVIIAAAFVAVSVDVAQAQNCGCSPRFRRESAVKVNFTETGKALFDGDMMFTKLDQMIFSGFRAAEHASRRWSRGEVYYEMSRMNGQAQQLIRQSLSALSQATGNCVRFTEIRLPYQGPYVSVFSGNGCYSLIGRNSPAQELSLGNGCLYDFTIQHEFMHALGFYHEQSRADRDQFVSVNWGAIDSSQCHNFQRCAGCSLTTTYDIYSIMQYVGTAFTCRQGVNTMVARSGQQIGWNRQLTASDVKKIRDYYQCSNGPSPVQ